MFEDYCRRAELAVVERPRDAPRDRPSASWSEAIGSQADVVAVRGRLADVIAVAQPDHRLGIGFNTFEAALLETGRLVLLCPPLPVSDIGRHVAIAWSGTVEAASAVGGGDADPGRRRPGDRALGAHRRRHRPRTGGPSATIWRATASAAEIRTFDARPTAVAQGLLAAAKDAGADLLLMGAYGHSRRRELVMGGVTKYITDHADLPVLLQR